MMVLQVWSAGLSEGILEKQSTVTGTKMARAVATVQPQEPEQAQAGADGPASDGKLNLKPGCQ